MVRVVITSFEPFGGDERNSSLEVGRAVARQPWDGVRVDWHVLPVVAGGCVERVWPMVAADPPVLVVALGQASGAARVRLEDRAVNFDHFQIADNAGGQTQTQPVVAGAPAVYRTPVPIARVVDRLRAEGHPVEHSFSAGSYVCNHYYFHLLHRTVGARLDTRALFVHLPLLPEQAAKGTDTPRPPARPLDEMVNAVAAVIRACLG